MKIPLKLVKKITNSKVKIKIINQLIKELNNYNQVFNMMINLKKLKRIHSNNLKLNTKIFIKDNGCHFNKYMIIKIKEIGQNYKHKKMNLFILCSRKKYMI